MATVDKAFRIKNGLVVEGSTATVNGSNVVTEASTEFLQDTVGAMVDGGTQTNISVTYDDTSGKLNFVAENGVADSTTDNLTEGSTNKYFTDERAQDAVATALSNGTHTNITVSYNDNSNAISLTGAVTYTDENAQDAVGNAVGTGLSYNDTTGAISVDTTTIQARVADVSDTEIGYLNGVTSSIQTQLDAKFATANASTSNISEGTNLYFTDERAQDAVGNAVGSGLDYDDTSGAISVDPSEFALNAVGAPTGSVSMATYKITSLGAPTNSTDAATKAYVDSVTEGLHIHESARAATTANVNLANALENGDILDGVTLATGDRVLVKNQTTTSENGIYVVQDSGQPTRATDFDTAQEVDSGDFIFVYAGTVNASTGWVQTNKPAIIGTDAIVFTQFSGAGTYLAGNGLTLTGNSFSINTTITADLSTAQTLINKTIDGGTNTLSNIANGSLSNSAITINGTSTSLGGSRTLVTDDIAEDGSPSNLWFTSQRAVDALQAVVPDFTAVEVNNISRQVAATVSLTDTNATTAYSWAKADYRAAKFLIKFAYGTHTEVSEVLLTLDTSDNIGITEYAVVTTNGSLGDITADISGSDVRIRVTAGAVTTTCHVVGTLIR